MKIKMKALAAGPDGVFLAGGTYATPHDLTDAKAQALVDGGYAEVVAESTPQPTVETADLHVENVEQAVQPRARSRSRSRNKE